MLLGNWFIGSLLPSFLGDYFKLGSQPALIDSCSYENFRPLVITALEHTLESARTCHAVASNRAQNAKQNLIQRRLDLGMDPKNAELSGYKQLITGAEILVDAAANAERVTEELLTKWHDPKWYSQLVTTFDGDQDLVDVLHTGIQVVQDYLKDVGHNEVEAVQHAIDEIVEGAELIIELRGYRLIQIFHGCR